MFYLIMVGYHVFFPLLSTLTWDTFLTLRGSQGISLNHVLPPRPSKSCGWGGVGWGGVVVVGWPKILVSAPVPLELIGIWVGLGWGWAGFGDRAGNT